MQALSDFLGLQKNDALCCAIAEKCHFSNMKSAKDAQAMKIDGANYLFGKGVFREWRKWFSASMLDDYYRVYEEWMKGSRFYKRYNRDTQQQ